MEARLFFNDDVQLIVKYDPETDDFLIVNEATGKGYQGTLEEPE